MLSTNRIATTPEIRLMSPSDAQTYTVEHCLVSKMDIIMGFAVQGGGGLLAGPYLGTGFFAGCPS